MTSNQPALAWADTSTREQVLVTGPDAVSFTQGMVTNDVASLAVGASCQVCLLTAKGALVAFGRAARLGDGMAIDVEPGRGAAALEFLSKYLISEEAELSPAPQHSTLALVGPEAAAVASTLPGVVATLASGLGSGVDVLLLREQLEAAKAALKGAPELSLAEQERLRIEAGVPKWGAELSERTIPLEANLEAALHYKKGCYIGQEVIARATYRGQMNKRLFGMLLGETPAPPMTELRQGERKIGWLTSVIRSPRFSQHIALGYVHRDFWSEPELALATGQTVRLVGLPFPA